MKLIKIIPIIALTTILIASCIEIPPEPVLPNWKTKLSIPFVDTIYFLKDAIEKNPNIITIGPYYQYHPDRYIFDPVEIGKQLSLNPISEVSYKHQLGNLSVQITDPVKFNLRAEELLGYTPPINQSPIPPISSRELSREFPQIVYFEYVHFQSGALILEIRNSLPIPIEFPNGINILNWWSSETIASFPHATIPPFSTWKSDSSSLSNKFVRNFLHFVAKFQSPGSGGASVSVNPDSGLAITLKISNGIADSLRGKIIQRTLIDTTYQPYILDDSIYIQQSTLKNGQIRITLENKIELPINLKIKVKEFKSISTNQYFRLDTTLAGNSLLVKHIDLRQWKIQSTIQQPTNTATFILTFTTTSDTLPTAVTVRATDKITTEITALDKPFYIKEISGISKPFNISLNDTIRVQLGQLSENFSADSIAFDSITMRVNLFTQAGHPTDIKAQLIGLNSQSIVTSVMNLPSNRPDGSRRIYPNITEVIEFNKQNSTIDEFLSNFLSNQPNKIVIKGTGLVNPPDIYPNQSGFLEDTTCLYPSLDLTVPLRIGIFNGAFIETTYVDNSSDNGEKIDKNVLDLIDEATIFFSIENAIPTSIGLEVKLLDKAGNNILSLPKTGQDSIKINRGTPLNPKLTQNPIALCITTDDAKKFEEAHRLVLRLGIDSDESLTVFTRNDYIRVRSFATLKININPK